MRSRPEALMILESLELFALDQNAPPLTTFRPWEASVLVAQQRSLPHHLDAQVTVFLECDVPLEALCQRGVPVLNYSVSIVPRSTSLFDFAFAWQMMAAMHRVTRFAFWLDSRAPSMSCSRFPGSVRVGRVGIRGCSGYMVSPTDASILVEAMSW
jgi:hypothetical protein